MIGKCVWGEAYIDTMFSFNIPSLLSSGNIGSLHDHDIEHHIYTTADDREKIGNDPRYRYLATQIKCSIIVPDVSAAVDAAGPYEAMIARMNAYHQRIIDDCAAVNAVWLFDQPDHVWGDGSLRHLVELSHDGWDVVFFPGVRVNIEEFTAAIGPWRDSGNGAIEISNRRLVDLSIKHMHFHDKTRFWGPPLSTDWPHHLAWRVAPGCFMRRCFYTQPFLIKTSDRPRLNRSIDFSYIEDAIERDDRIHFIADTDDFFVLEVSRKYRFSGYSLDKVSMSLVGNWAIRYASSAHLDGFSRSVVYHSEDVPRRRLKHIDRFAGTVSHAIRAMVELDRVATSIAADHPRAATFIRLCLNHSKLIRRIKVPFPFTLRLPPEAEIPSPEVLQGTQSPGELDRVAEWIRPYITAEGSDRIAIHPVDDVEAGA